jgi:hypothetical protein
MSSSNMQIQLDYFKQGDDLNYFLEKAENACSALLNHAEMLKQSAKTLEDIYSIVSKYDSSLVTINADCHFISINGPEEMLKELEEKSLVVANEFDCDEEEESD